MIVDALMDALTAVVQWLTGLWPGWTLPSFLTDPTAGMSTILSDGASLGVWFYWPILTTVVGAVLTAYGVNLVTRGLRWLVGLFPTMGGGS